MVAESFCQNHQNVEEEEEEVKAPFILGLQPSALVDNVAHVDLSLLDRIPGERGGSIPVCTPFFLSYFIFLFNYYCYYLYLVNCMFFRLQLKSLNIYLGKLNLIPLMMMILILL
jgi:hypothetical protein